MSEAGFKSRWDFELRLTPESNVVIFFENVIYVVGLNDTRFMLIII